MALWTIGLFVVVEPLIGQALEPLVYGHSTGLSPVAVILAGVAIITVARNTSSKPQAEERRAA